MHRILKDELGERDIAPGFGKLIQDHKAMIKKFPHRVQVRYQVDFEFSFDP